MKQIKYLNAVLTVIAICLVVITMSVAGFIPTASAKQPINNKFMQVPVNKDGSITVKLATGAIAVNIEEVDGYSILGSSLPVKIKE